ncbi:MAG: hypothetical protein ACRCXM_03020 [Beijerinckiaceae bacterium]
MTRAIALVLALVFATAVAVPMTSSPAQAEACNKAKPPGGATS